MSQWGGEVYTQQDFNLWTSPPRHSCCSGRWNTVTAVRVNLLIPRKAQWTILALVPVLWVSWTVGNLCSRTATSLLMVSWPLTPRCWSDSILPNCYYSNLYGLVFNTNDTAPSDLDFWPNDACSGVLSNRVHVIVYTLTHGTEHDSCLHWLISTYLKTEKSGTKRHCWIFIFYIPFFMELCWKRHMNFIQLFHETHLPLLHIQQ